MDLPTDYIININTPIQRYTRALQWDGTYKGYTSIYHWLVDKDCIEGMSYTPEEIVLYVNEDVFSAKKNDWVVEDSKYDIYTCSSESFSKMFTKTKPMVDVEKVAHVCHEANRALQIINEEEPSPHWMEAPEWQVQSAFEGVESALDGQTPEQLHESWCNHKYTEGWVYGPVKDSKEKTHPCLVPYAELPLEQREKDHVFYAIVQSLAGSTRQDLSRLYSELAKLKVAAKNMDAQWSRREKEHRQEIKQYTSIIDDFYSRINEVKT